MKRSVKTLFNIRGKQKAGYALFVLGMCAITALPMSEPMRVLADTTVSGNDSSDKASDSLKNQYYTKLMNYKSNLYIANTVTKASKDKIEKLYYSANAYIANYEMSESELASYVSAIEAQMASIISGQTPEEAATTKEFLAVADNYSTSIGQHGKEAQVSLPIINLGTEDVTDVVITPKTSALVKEWPFEIDKTSYTQTIDLLPGNPDKDTAVQNRRELYYTFRVRDDVLTGYYKLEFDLTYKRKGAVETATLPIYVQMEGAPGSRSIDHTKDEDAKKSTPRIIVTGFETNPETVFAGDTFELSIHVRNTSQRTSVSNVEFDLEAAVEGKDENATYSAFLPTSGSNTVYINNIPQGGTADLNIEMTAKVDLAQKPYVLNIKMNYEDDNYNPYEATASVSIPVKQESKFETSSPEITPTELTVGEQSNIMFSIYNTGKTTLYNTKVKFVADSIEGGDTFVGKIEPGATGNVDAMVTGKATTMDDGTIKAIISYENESGKVTEEEKLLTLSVMEGYDDIPMEPTEEEMVAEPNYTIWIVAGVIVGIILVVVVVKIIRKKKKKAKEAKELEEDLAGIDNENS